MIRRLLLASVASSALACAASAADVPVAPEPAYYPAGPAPTPYYDWSGIYFGLNAGGAWASQSGGTASNLATGGLGPTPSNGSVGFGGGGQIGYNWFSGKNFVLGVEGDFDALSNRTTRVDPAATYAGKINFVSTARARFGLTADRFMWFFTGGFAWGQDAVTRTEGAGAFNNAAPGTVESVTNTRTGWTIGTGLEYAFAESWTVRLEYLYVQLQGLTYTFPLAQLAITASPQGINEFRLGVNYKFNWLAAPPISARD